MESPELPDSPAVSIAFGYPPSSGADSASGAVPSSPAASEQALRGGVNEVLRRGDVVHRPAGAWTPAVHRLLAALAQTGFAGAPRVHGYDDAGREVLDFVAGDVPTYPLPAWARSDDALVAVARLLRGAHDASVPCALDAGPWCLPPREPREVVCHGDAAPYNTVFRDGVPVAFIDWDTAHPGPRVWDVAYLAYRWAPLTHPDNPDGFGSPREQVRRALLIADAYGLDGGWPLLRPAVVARVAALASFLRLRAAAGDPAFAAHVARGDDLLYDRDAAWVAGLSV